MSNLPSVDVDISDKRIAVVDALRGFGAMWIVASVIVRTAWPTANHTGYGAVVTLAPIGLFAVLSGFVLSLDVLSTGRPVMPRLDVFAAERLLRFVPIVWAAVLATMTLDALWIGDVSGTVWDSTLPITASAAVTQMLFLPGFVVNRGPNPSVIGVALLVHCTLAFPVLVLLWRRIGSVALAAAGFGLALSVEFVDAPRVAPSMLAVGLFAVGMALGGVVTEQTIRVISLRTHSWWVVALVTGAAVFAAFSSLSAHAAVEHQALLAIGVAVCAVSLVLHVIDNPFAVSSRVLQLHPLRAVGVMSLSVALSSGPVVQLVWKTFCDGSRLGSGAVAVLCALGSPAVFSLAMAMSIWFERPCLGGPERDVFFAQVGLSRVQAPRAIPAPVSAERLFFALALRSLVARGGAPNGSLHVGPTPQDATQVVLDLRESIIDLREQRVGFAPPMPPPDPHSLLT